MNRTVLDIDKELTYHVYTRSLVTGKISHSKESYDEQTARDIVAEILLKHGDYLVAWVEVSSEEYTNKD